MARSFSILLVDDNTDSDFFEPLADRASNTINAELYHVPTWDQAVARLEDDPYEFQGLILDGKGQKTGTSKAEDDSFLKTVLERLKEKAREGYYIPYVIYTGYAEELTKYFDGEPIFWKGKGEEDIMFRALKEQVLTTDVHRCRQLYPEIFDLFKSRRLSRSLEPELAKAMEVIENNFIGRGRDVAQSLRLLLESSFMTLHSLDSQMIAARFIEGGYPNVSGIIRHLAGSPEWDRETRTLIHRSEVILPAHIHHVLKAIYELTSSTAMHFYEAGTSPYLLKTITSGTLEYLTWFKAFTNENYPIN